MIDSGFFFFLWHGIMEGRLRTRRGRGSGGFFVCLFFLYICFIDKRARGKQRRPVYHKNTNGEKKEKNPSGLEQTANESDVWFTLLFTLFLVACPFSSQRSALSCLQSSSPQQGSPWSQLPAPLWPWATSAGRLGVCEGVWAGYSWSSNPVSSLRSVRAMLQSSQQLGDGVNQLDTLSSNYAYSHRHTHMKHIYLWHVSASSQASDWGGGLSPAWPATRRIYSGELWDRWPAGGLCSRADRICSSDPRGLDGSMSQPAHTLTHTPARPCVCIWTDSCLTSTTSHISATERHPSLFLLCSLSLSFAILAVHFFPRSASGAVRLPANGSAIWLSRYIAGAKRLIGVWVRRRLSLILFQVCRQTAQRLHFSI